MKEAELSRVVLRMCRDRGLLAYRVPSVRTPPPTCAGWPDFCICGRRIVFRELKGSETRLERHQSAVGARLTAAGGNWAVWRPEDLASGLIERELDDLASWGSLSGTGGARAYGTTPELPSVRHA